MPEGGDKEVERFWSQRDALNLLTRLVRNCDHEKKDAKKDSVNVLLRLWSHHVYSILRDFESAAKANQEQLKDKPQITNEDLGKILGLFRILVPTIEGANISDVLGTRTARPILKDVIKSPEVPEGVKVLAALAYCEGWDDEAIKFMRTVAWEIKNSVLKQVILHKMLQDCYLQKYRTSTADAFRNLIADFEISLGLPKFVKSTRLAELGKSGEEAA